MQISDFQVNYVKTAITMEQPMNKSTRIVLLIIFALCLTSLCGCRRTPYPIEHVMVVSQTSYAYPSGNAVEHDSRSEILETDEYGRVLFAYYNGFGVYSVGIRQKHDEKYVYYYDNVSFLYTMKYREYTPEQASDLKEANDWNKPLDEEKMIKRAFLDQYSLKKKIDPLFDHEDLQRVFNASIEYKENESVIFYLVDSSQTGQQLFNVWRREKVSTTNGYEYTHLNDYLMILNSDGTYDPENYLIEFKDQSEISAKLAEIKEKNGWVG